MSIKKLLRYLAYSACLLMTVLSSSPLSSEETQDTKVLRGGWYLFDPYQYQKESYDQKQLTGLDIELLKAITEKAGYTITFEEVAWRQHLEDIKHGTRDIAAAALRTDEREKYAYYSAPYRKETTAFYLPKGTVSNITVNSAEALVSYFKQTHFRLGVIDGYAYSNPKINAFIADPKNSKNIIRVENDYKNFKNLKNNRIDGFFADQIVASTTGWRSDMQQYVDVHPLKFSQDVHLIFSKATVTLDVVEDFNKAIKKLKESGSFNKINKEYIFPLLLSQTVDSTWFFAIDIMGTIVFVFSGLLLAYKYKYDIFGAFVLASLPAVGGGVIRDLITNRTPIALLASPLYILIIVATVITGYAALKAVVLWRNYLSRSNIYKSQRLRKFINLLIKIFDAMGLAAFTVTGVLVALGTKSEPLWLWGPLLATITGAGGGILRDVVRSDPDIPALKGVIYPEIALLWGGFLSLFLIWQSSKIDPDAILFGVIVTMVGVFVTRMLVVYYQLRSPGYY